MAAVEINKRISTEVSYDDLEDTLYQIANDTFEPSKANNPRTPYKINITNTTEEYWHGEKEHSSIAKILKEFPKVYIDLSETVLPEGITNLTRAFQDCENVVIAPPIPDTVTDMTFTFYNCKNLLEVPRLPKKIPTLNSTFNGVSRIARFFAPNKNSLKDWRLANPNLLFSLGKRVLTLDDVNNLDARQMPHIANFRVDNSSASAAPAAKLALQMIDNLERFQDTLQTGISFGEYTLAIENKNVQPD